MDQGGRPQPFVMGCYGIGVSRTPAAAVEQNFDDKGIVWPAPIAPFECVVALLDPKREEQKALGDRLYRELQAAGVDVCLDDRALAPGAKFKDNELLGFPVQVFVGRRAGEGMIEFLVRRGMQKSEVAAAEVVAKVRAALRAAGAA
jgi:prolyl-tRNA synthetase